ncbi:B-cell antigen receptor complex-associated protein alpha chain isoform X3 [Poecile atricapillus]|uniref:B-cell antigen receptor complex-associated protein alpha chain isoform X3 n=1 Tax=Poecile atricapillus TaxID=48891 RepID=UPI00273A599B|nr:B-cell antigen receptor complex-associated protein alpha chain isoform X3 [Poecile atricapillus]
MQLMAAAPQIQGAPPKQGVPSPLLLSLLLLLLLPGCQCQSPAYPPAVPPRSEPPEPLAVAINPASGPSCGSSGELRVWPGPTSRSAAPGEPLSLECRFEAPPAATVTWLQVCPRRYHSWGCSWPQEVPAAGGGRQVDREGCVSTLSFQSLQHNHSGLYFCRLQLGEAAAQSCGTFVRVHEPVPVPFLQLRDATKNRILTAQGVLLLLCAAGPGLLLLFRKRWANERLLQPKKIALEEENLYEGLNLDECSMYEDISRGVQATYQDVGTPPAADGLLEKP